LLGTKGYVVDDDFKSCDSYLFCHSHLSVYFELIFYLSLLLSTQAGSQPITSVSWLPTLRLLVTTAKDGSLQVWKTRVIINPNRQPMETHFFERAG
jgi:WD40 repeat protein